MIKRLNIDKYHYVALIGWVAKIFTVIFSLVNTRMLLDMIGVQGFALYSIIFSLGGWLFLFNFSIPSAVQNTISKFRAKNKDLKKVYQTVVFMTIVIIIFAIPSLYIISEIIYKTILIKYASVLQFQYLYIVLFLLFLFGLTDVYNKILFGLHKGYWPNVYPAFIAISGFFILSILKYISVNNIGIVILLFMIPYLIIFILSYIQSVGLTLPKFHRDIFLELFLLIKKFFIFAILATLVLHVDYIIMSKILKASEIAIYNLDMRIFNLILFMYWTLLSALWPIASELFHKNNLKEIRKKIHVNMLYGLIITLFLSMIIIYFKDDIFLLVSGVKNLQITYTTALLTISYILIRVWSDSYAKILQGMNEINILIYLVPFQAVLSITLQYILGKEYGINGIIIGLTFSFLFTVAWVLPLKFYKLTKDKNE